MINAILVVDDERRFDGHPRHHDIFCARTADEAIQMLRERTLVNVHIQELWLDFSLGVGGDIMPVLHELVAIAQSDPAFAKDVLVRTTTSSSGGADLIKEILAPHYTFGDPVVE